MKTIILLSLLGKTHTRFEDFYLFDTDKVKFTVKYKKSITVNQAYGGEADCTSATLSCATSSSILGKTTCSEKLPFFKCLRDGGCDGGDSAYMAQVKGFSYEKCGASAIIMGWTLPILMFTVAKYFSNC